jgi:hypothetical protein
VKVIDNNLKCLVFIFCYFCLVFPPLSLSALTEYRPTLTPNVSSASTKHSQKQQQQHQRQKTTEKTDFIWEQSIVTPRHE